MEHIPALIHFAHIENVAKPVKYKVSKRDRWYNLARDRVSHLHRGLSQLLQLTTANVHRLQQGHNLAFLNSRSTFTSTES